MSEPVPVSFNERRKLKRKRTLFFELDNLGRRGKAILIIVAAILLLGGLAAVVSVYNNSHKKKPVQLYTKTGEDVTISQSQYAQRELNYAHTKLETKEYSDATIGYFSSASDSYQLNNLTAAKAVLLECTHKVPDKYVTWDIYYQLAVIAKDQKDTSAEKRYLKTAQTKGNAQGADINSSQKAAINKRLAELGA